MEYLDTAIAFVASLIAFFSYLAAKKTANDSRALTLKTLIEYHKTAQVKVMERKKEFNDAGGQLATEIFDERREYHEEQEKILSDQINEISKKIGKG